jgi:hypothetical protein
MSLRDEVLAEFEAWFPLERFRARDGFSIRSMQRNRDGRAVREAERKRDKYWADVDVARLEAREKYARLMKNETSKMKRRVRLREWMRAKRAKEKTA